ncbi:MAG TPA: hypothetical protein VGR56_10195, partial [Nitrososphaerales archaeon]|nr:hypothetical protein [Nitrososphaerales archaeon]
MTGLDPGYLSIYFISIASVAAIIISVFLHSSQSSVSLNPGRLLGLTKDEARRLASGDAVFLMHLSIALGVGLTIASTLLDPAIDFVPFLRTAILAVSVPLVAGLAAAFAWRIQRFVQSKKVEAELRTGKSFASASTYLQIILMLAIALTASELILLWLSGLALLGGILGILRNGLVVVYYSKPSVNLIGFFDKPLAFVKTPFSLADVISGKTDPS